VGKTLCQRGDAGIGENGRTSQDGGGLVWADVTDYQFKILPPMLLKVDAAGQEEWTKRMPEDFLISDVNQAKSGRFLVMGVLRPEPEKLQLIKLSGGEDTEWMKAIEVEGGAINPGSYNVYWHFSKAPDGGLVALGPERLVKIGASGEIEWEKQVNNASHSYHRVLVTDSGDMYLQGNEISEDVQLYIAKLNKEGDLLWENSYPEARGKMTSLHCTSIPGAMSSGRSVTVNMPPEKEAYLCLRQKMAAIC
jgi:hypothetical protein